ncbi:PDR/VanB family oxidoreductase [Dietzia sp. PP-33]|jgi:ferredoxin-NADP reductase|uniref:PDR/VanB family oxidoreductase n=1 Tax=Dietzia sp. PP-33 TaxID=2957500 RepID=UPI0029A9E941|nr:PDR/VanB family oxidoreductase [Dietzia sp. PP-33]MDX2355901.1 PDR/VanB family oxidoreductase [Dietzia sp. PP-33]
MTMLQDPLRADIVHLGDGSSGDVSIDAVVAGRRDVAEGVVELVLEAADGGDLPVWEPGAHIDIVLDDGAIRQYSLCGDPADPTTYRVAILREPDGRGGSRRIHEELHPGARVEIKGPRNHFPLRESPRYLFIAGGIGVTPLIPMMRAAEAAGAEWRFVYGGRSESTMGYVDELRAWGDRVTIWPEDSHGLIDLERLLGSPEEGTLVYSCGPEPLLAAVEKRCATWPQGSLNLERFSAVEVDTSRDSGFDVELRQTGTTLHVDEDQTILEVVTEAGVYVSTSCTEGTCGSCETTILEGTADHRDVVLSPEEQDAQETMMICVSRATCPRLVLDL